MWRGFECEFLNPLDQFKKKFVEIEELTAEKGLIVVENEDIVSEYFLLDQQLDKIKGQIREILNMPIHSVPYLQPGKHQIPKPNTPTLCL